ncbi:MAG: metallophosphoesterase [Clostridia bacterium]|nr:metallophosphoesterase [Clostridia bacterium]
MKYFTVSDIHDHFSLMRAALDREGFDPSREDHVLVLCGDAFYSGPEPGELFEYLSGINSKGRLVFIYGNHDYELLDNLKSSRFGRKGNRTCAEKAVVYLSGKGEGYVKSLSDEELSAECERHGFTEFLERVPVPFFETEHYVFTHGFIPTDRKKYYRDDWRDATEREWRGAASTGDGMKLSMLHGIRVPGKIVVFGHYSAARCFLMQNASPDDWAKRIYTDVSSVPPEGFRPFFGDSFIALDQSVNKTGFVNCVVLTD